VFDSVQRRAADLARDGLRVRRLVDSCRELLSERGEAAGVSRARSTLDRYRELSRKEQAKFFAALLDEFSPHPGRVLAASQAYAADPSAAHLAAMITTAEPPRQELLRRLNRAPGGTGVFLRMRERLLELAREERELDAVDWDFRHLLSSWFNPGFLEIVRVDWRTPAYVLEQIIAHEAVHAIRGFDDLRRRLESDRRCFAFFHPALRDEPLIFVEVALMDRMPDAVQPLIDLTATSTDPARASTAAFYSISNCQPGLRGVSLGNFLIKGVVGMLSREFPRLKTFCTLSPVPGLRPWVASRLAQGEPGRAKPLTTALGMLTAAIGENGGELPEDTGAAFARLVPLEAPIVRLAATYLINHGRAGEPVQDLVARFHLNNGARLERVNFMADRSPKGLRESFGVMVNYLYEPDAIEANHEKFAGGETVAARRVRSLALT
jgi:malonyl-CoA decarboxylase